MQYRYILACHNPSIKSRYIFLELTSAFRLDNLVLDCRGSIDRITKASMFTHASITSLLAPLPSRTEMVSSSVWAKIEYCQGLLRV